MVLEHGTHSLPWATEPRFRGAGWTQTVPRMGSLPVLELSVDQRVARPVILRGCTLPSCHGKGGVGLPQKKWVRRGSQENIFLVGSDWRKLMWAEVTLAVVGHLWEHWPARDRGLSRLGAKGKVSKSTQKGP